jgi:hypothetical protein
MRDQQVTGLRPKIKFDKTAVIIGLVLSALGIAAGIYLPEIRSALRLERPPEVAKRPPIQPAPSPSPTPALAPVVVPRITARTAHDLAGLRRLNKVARLPTVDSGKSLDEIPGSSFCFTDGFSILEGHEPSKMEVLSNAPLSYFEIDKLADSSAWIIGYVGPETRDHLVEGVEQGKDVVFTVYSDNWEHATNVIAFPLEHIKGLRQRLTPLTKSTLEALDFTVK